MALVTPDMYVGPILAQETVTVTGAKVLPGSVAVSLCEAGNGGLAKNNSFSLNVLLA